MTRTLELTATKPGIDKSTLELSATPVDVDKLDTAKPLVEIFAPYQTTLEKWEAKAKSLIVSDISQKAEMQMARVARLELRAARIGMDKTRLGLVEELKARTSKIDGTARIIREKIEGLEAILLESEEFSERYAAKVKDELKRKREAEVIPLLSGPTILGDLSDLSEGDYGKYLDDLNLLRQAKIDAAAKAESDRLAKEAADKAERERIAAENERLKVEAVEAARIAEADRKRAAEVLAEQKAQAEEQRRAEKAKADAEAAETARLAEIERKRLAEERAAELAKAAEDRQRIEAERAKEKAEAAAELKRLEDRRKVEIEAERKLRQAAEDEARKEREAIQAQADEDARKLKKELDRRNSEIAARVKAEDAEKARIEADRVAKERESKRAAAAPDNAKLTALVRTIRGIDVPSFSNQSLAAAVEGKVEELARFLESQINSELL